MKSRILQLLSQKQTVSGEALSRQLNVSRVTIWKHINQLREAGYQIKSTGKGYQLKSAPDSPFSWEFPEREGLVHYFDEIPSTMAKAKELARNGCPAYSVVIAETQTSGRGRLQRTWVSDKGGLYFTVVLRPEIPPALMGRVSFAASLCLSRAIEKETGILASVKWPNDLLVGKKKLCGILSEMDVTGEAIDFLNIGIGINANNQPERVESNAVSLRNILNRPVDRKSLLSSFLTELEQELASPSLDHIISEWKERTITLNRQVKIVTTGETFEGEAIDVDENGALILRLPDQSTKKVFFGDCFIQPD